MKNLFISLLLFALFSTAGCGMDRAVVYSLEYADTGISQRAGFDGESLSGSSVSTLEKEADASELTVGKLVNINTADEAQLMSLKGIGRVRAAAIIEYRTQNGEFGAIEDIMNVSGIKEGTFAKIRDSITIR